MFPAGLGDSSCWRIPVFIEYVVDVPRAVIRGHYMVSDGNAMNVWIMQTIEHLAREA